MAFPWSQTSNLLSRLNPTAHDACSQASRSRVLRPLMLQSSDHIPSCTLPWSGKLLLAQFLYRGPTLRYSGCNCQKGKDKQPGRRNSSCLQHPLGLAESVGFASLSVPMDTYLHLENDRNLFPARLLPPAKVESVQQPFVGVVGAPETPRDQLILLPLQAKSSDRRSLTGELHVEVRGGRIATAGKHGLGDSITFASCASSSVRAEPVS